MDDMRGLMQQMLEAPEEPTAQAPEERSARMALMARLFRAYAAKDPQRAVLYAEETAEIPWPFLRHAVKLVVRHRVYASLPTVGELWTAARAVAGMDRQRYRAGHYLPPPTTWPPNGRRYAITAGEYEPLPDTLPALGSGERKALGAGS